MEPGRIYPDRSPLHCDPRPGCGILVDKADVDESNATASIQNIAQVFTRTQSAPGEGRAVFSKVAATAQSLDGYHSQTAAADFTKATVFGKLKSMLAAGKLRRYKAKGGLIMYVSSAIMDALEQSSSLPETSS